MRSLNFVRVLARPGVSKCPVRASKLASSRMKFIFDETKRYFEGLDVGGRGRVACALRLRSRLAPSNKKDTRRDDSEENLVEDSPSPRRFHTPLQCIRLGGKCEPRGLDTSWLVVGLPIASLFFAFCFLQVLLFFSPKVDRKARPESRPESGAGKQTRKQERDRGALAENKF